MMHFREHENANSNSKMALLLESSDERKINNEMGQKEPVANQKSRGDCDDGTNQLKPYPFMTKHPRNIIIDSHSQYYAMLSCI